MLKTLLLLVLLSCGCRTSRKECNLVELANAHPDMQQALKEHESLMMDMMKRIAILEQETGHYR